MSPRAAIEVEGLAHTYEQWGVRTRALDGITLDVPVGQWVNLVGPNGSGKSTFLSILAGDLQPEAGQVHFFIEGEGEGAPRRDGLTAYRVQQDPTAGTAAAMTVDEHLRLVRRLARKRGCEVEVASELPFDASTMVQHLSGGQRQFLTIYMARIHPARVVLLDEPLSALDDNWAAGALDLIEGLTGAGKTVVMVTHDLALAFDRGDRTIGFEQGRIQYDSEDGRRELEHYRSL